MQRKSMITALIAAAFALPLAANAGGDKPRAKTASAKTASETTAGVPTAEAFRTADKNGDGFVSMDEASGSAHAASFASLDKNADGKLSQVEFAGWMEQAAGQPGSKVESVTTSIPTDASVAKKN